MPSEARKAKLGYTIDVYYTYILKLKNNRLYVGYTKNLKERMFKHNRGGVRNAINNKPVELVFYAACTLSKKARSFEKYLNSSSGKAFSNKRVI